jgi:AraC family transcriptional regulator
MTQWTNEAIICDTLCKSPEISFRFQRKGVVVNRWRQFVGSYALPALPHPIFVVQLAGKTDVRIGERGGWSERTSFPGAASVVPAGYDSRWLVDGELDVITFAFEDPLVAGRMPAIFRDLRFAYSDPLGAALSDQMLDELCRDGDQRDETYLEALADALFKHVDCGRTASTRHLYPTSGASSFRIHKIMNAINRDPAGDYNLKFLADQAGVTVSYFCRIFKQAVGMSPHDYVLKVRLDRAKQLLAKPEIPISRVAELCGFAGSSQFTRSFNQNFGQSPSAYRVGIGAQG